MAKSLEDVIQEAGGPVNLLWESKTPPAVVPRVVPEFTNWRTEQLAWRRTAVLFDQSHHMADLNIKGPDALRLISDLAVNSVENFSVDMAKQFVAVNYDGYVIGDNILFHLEDDEYQAVGIPPSINWPCGVIPSAPDKNTQPSASTAGENGNPVAPLVT